MSWYIQLPTSHHWHHWHKIYWPHRYHRPMWNVCSVSVCGYLTSGKRNRLCNKLANRAILKVNNKLYDWLYLTVEHSVTYIYNWNWNWNWKTTTEISLAVGGADSGWRGDLFKTVWNETCMSGVLLVKCVWNRTLAWGLPAVTVGWILQSAAGWWIVTAFEPTTVFWWAVDDAGAWSV